MNETTKPETNEGVAIPDERMVMRYTHGYHNGWPVILKDGDTPVDDFVGELNELDQALKSDAYKRGYSDAIEQCINAASMPDRAGHEWVKNSLYQSIIDRIIARLRKLADA